MQPAINIEEPNTQDKQLSLSLVNHNIESLVPDLDRMLASTMVLFHQYQKHSWVLSESTDWPLKKFYDDAVGNIRAQADAIARRIVMLSGTPTSRPKAQAEKAFVEHEPKGSGSLTGMLQSDHHLELQILGEMKDLILKAHTVKDHHSATLLRGLTEEITERKAQLLTLMRSSSRKKQKLPNFMRFVGSPIIDESVPGPNW